MAEQTILIAEDDPDIRDGVRIPLAGEEYRILETENGLRALELYRGQTLVYSSFAPKGGLPEETARDPGDRVAFYDWSPSYTLNFADGEAEALLYYNGLSDYYSTGCEILNFLCLLWWFPGFFLFNSRKNIWSNKFRTFLTMLGIIIGVTAVIVIVGLGNGMTQSIESSFADMGTDLLSVQVMGYGSRSVKVDDFYAIVDSRPDLYNEVSPTPALNGTVKVGTASYSTTAVKGVSESYLAMSGYSVETGRNINYVDLTDNKKVCVVGAYLSRVVYGGNAVGQTIKIGADKYTIVGVLEAKVTDLSSQEGSGDDLILVPYTTALRASGSNTSGSYAVTIADGIKASEAKQVLEEGIQKLLNSDSGYFVTSMSEMLSQMTSIIDMVVTILTAIAAISLLVGGIGVSALVLPVSAAGSSTAVQTAVTLGGFSAGEDTNAALTRGRLAKLLVAFSAYRESANTQGTTGTLSTVLHYFASGASYVCYVNGQQVIYQTSTKYPVLAGGVAIGKSTSGTVKSMRQLLPAVIDKVGAASVMSGGEKYETADDMQVYLWYKGTYYPTTLSQVNSEDYSLIGWYDANGSAAGGKIRVLIAEKKD